MNKEEFAAQVAAHAAGRIASRLKYHYLGTHRVEEAGNSVYIRYA